MAVDHTALKSHWQFLQNRTANDLFAAFYIVTKQLTQKLEEQKAKATAAENFLAISNPIIAKGSPVPHKSWKEVIESDSKPNEVQLGKKLFDAFSKAYQSTICSTRGVMGALLKGTVNTNELPVLIATHLLVNHFSEDAAWNDFVSVFAVLLNNLGVEEFCSQ